MKSSESIIILQKQIEQLTYSINTLCNLCNVIKEYGVSVPILKAADPYGELITCGICPAYEQLDTINDNDTVLYGIESKIKDMRRVRAIAVEGLFEKIKNLFSKKVDEINKYEKNINEALKRFDEIKDFDENAFLATETKYAVNTKQTFDNIARSFHKIYPIISNNVIKTCTSDLMNKLYKRSPNLSEEVDQALKKIGNVFKPLVNNKDTKENFAFTAVLTPDGKFDKIRFHYSEGYPKHKEVKLIKDSGFRISDLKRYSKEAIDLGNLVEKIFIDYDSGIVSEFRDREEKLSEIADEMNYNKEFRTIEHLVNVIADLYYFQSVFETVGLLEYDIHTVLVAAIKSAKSN